LLGYRAGVLRAIVTGSFVYPGGRTAISLQVLEGVVKPGEVVRLSLPSRTMDVTIRGAGYADHNVGRPDFYAEIVMLVDEPAPGDVPKGTDVRTL
jgi:hypothetical protein